MSTNENWEEFKERIFGTPYMIWHDGVGDYSRELAREDPDHVRKMLQEGLSNDDYVAVEALKQVNLPEFIPDLLLRLPNVKGKFQIELATMLQEKLAPSDDRFAKVVIHELLYPSWLMRIDAAILLRKFPASFVTGALLERVTHDSDYLVRYHSAESYLKVLGIKPASIFEHEEIFPLIISPGEGKKQTQDDFERYKQAAEMLRALKTPEA